MTYSIIIATYNRRELLALCVESVLSQTYKNWELIVVDDGSTDGTEILFREKKFSDARVRYVRLPKNQGPSAARNRGLDEATGDALIIWDSDDRLLPHALEAIERTFTETSADVVAAETQFFRGGRPVPLERRENGWVSYEEWLCGKRPRGAEVIALKKGIVGSSRFHSRNLDFMFYSDAVKDARVWYLNEVVGEVYIHPDALSTLRRAPNASLSRERAPYLKKHLERHGRTYRKSCPGKYASYAYGASVGFLLAREVSLSRTFARGALRVQPGRPRHLIWFLFTLFPFAPFLLETLFEVRRATCQRKSI